MIASDVQKLAAGSIVDLFELDATQLGDIVYRWANEVNELGNSIIWNGQEYAPLPIEAEGFEKTGTGKSPRPTIRVANVTGLVGALARSLNDLVGAKVTRRRTFVRFLDAINFSSGNPQADPNTAFPDEIWFVDRKSSENGIFVEFELASAADLRGVKLPRRQADKNYCSWRYRSTECSYTGAPVADANDRPASTLEADKCSHKVTGCKLRFGERGVLPFGAFVGVGRV